MRRPCRLRPILEATPPHMAQLTRSLGQDSTRPPLAEKMGTVRPLCSITETPHKKRISMHDDFLVERAQTGDSDAFRILVLRYQQPLFKFLSAYLKGQSGIEDIAQETFLRAHRHIGRYDQARGARFSTWLFTIAKRLALNELARTRPETGGPDAEAVSDAGPLAAETIDEHRRRERVRAAVRQLKEPYRAAIVLSYLKELSLEDVAAIEECSVGTIKSRIFRGKQLLRCVLQEFTEVKL